MTAQAAERPAEFSREHRDCSVFAVSAIAGVSYEQAHRALATVGRRARCGVSTVTARRALEVLGCKHVGQRSFFGRVNEREALNHVRPVGRYLIRTARHFYAIVDGQVLDNWPAKRARKLLSVTEVTW
jgi:hypothetical protein